MDQEQIKLATISFGDDTAYIEVSRNNNELVDNGPTYEDLKIDGQGFQKTIIVGKHILDETKKLDVDEIELEFGVKASGEGGFFCFAKASAEAHFNVKIKWKK